MYPGAPSLLPDSYPGAPAPRRVTVRGLVPGLWYRLEVVSSLARSVFGDAAGQQIQARLARQGLDVRQTTPLPAQSDFAYASIARYLQGSGAIYETPGVRVLSATRALPEDAPTRERHVDERPVPVHPGARYAGRASISWPLSALVTRDRVLDALKKRGFGDARVYLDADELPARWPASERGGDLFAEATYTGSAPTAVLLPSQVISVWEMEA